MEKLGLLFVAMVSIVLMISCVSKQIPVAETYYETEYRPTTEKEINSISGETIIEPKLRWYINGIQWAHLETPLDKSTNFFLYVYLDNQYTSWVGIPDCSPISASHSNCIGYFGYELPRHDKSRIEIIVDRGHRDEIPSIWAYDVSNVGQIAGYNGRFPHYTTYRLTTYPYGGTTTSGPYGDLSTLETKQAEEWLASFNSKLNTAHYLGNGTQWIDELAEIQQMQNEIKQMIEKPIKYDDLGKVFGPHDDLCDRRMKLATLKKIDSIGVTELGLFLNISDDGTEPIKELKLIWSDDVVNEKKITKPYQVEKQRTVMQTKKVPFWETILH